LTIRGGTAKLRNLVFEIEADGTPETILVAAVAARYGAQVTFEKCRFVQKGPIRRPLIEKRALTPLAPVAALNPEAHMADGPPGVTFQDCVFESGQVAVALNGQVEAQAFQCLFRPHGSLFHLAGDPGEAPAKVKLKNCSAFVMYGPAFRLDEK